MSSLMGSLTHWLPIEFRITYKNLCMLHKVNSTTAPSYLFLETSHPKRKELFRLPKCKNEITKRSETMERVTWISTTNEILFDFQKLPENPFVFQAFWNFDIDLQRPLLGTERVVKSPFIIIIVVIILSPLVKLWSRRLKYAIIWLLYKGYMVSSVGIFNPFFLWPVFLRNLNLFDVIFRIINGNLLWKK